MPTDYKKTGEKAARNDRQGEKTEKVEKAKTPETREPEPLDEKSLDEVMRDCPL